MFAMKDMQKQNQGSYPGIRILRDYSDHTYLANPDALWLLQRSLGNDYLQTAAVGNQAIGTPIELTGEPKIQRACACGGACGSCSEKEDELRTIQTKLTISQPGDNYEQQADQVAKQIMQIPDSSGQAENEGGSIQEFATMCTITPTGDEEEFATLTASGLSVSQGETSTSDVIQTQAIDGSSNTSDHCAPTGRFTDIPSGTLMATFGSGTFGASFNMKADFGTAIPCTCVRGEYRQFVRGYAKKNGTSIVHRLCSNTMDPTTWYEDCVTSGSRNLKYGYHSIPFANSRFTNPDQATGCTFNGFDYPGFPLSSVSSGDTLEMHLEFEGKLVDAGNGDAELASSSWTVEGTGTVP